MAKAAPHSSHLNSFRPPDQTQINIDIGALQREMLTVELDVILQRKDGLHLLATQMANEIAFSGCRNFKRIKSFVTLSSSSAWQSNILPWTVLLWASCSALVLKRSSQYLQG